MSAIIVLALVFALAFFVGIAFVAVVVAIHTEPRHQMARKAPRPLAAIVRRFLGVYVGKPDNEANDDHREECLTGSSTDWWNKGGWDR